MKTMKIRPEINNKMSTKRLLAQFNKECFSKQLMYLLHKRMWTWIVKQYTLKRYMMPTDLKLEWMNLNLSPSDFAYMKLLDNSGCFMCIAHKDGWNCHECPLGSCVNENTQYCRLVHSIRTSMHPGLQDRTLSNTTSVELAKKILMCSNLRSDSQPPRPKGRSLSLK